MSRSSHQREKYGSSSRISHEEGTAARTRPFSFDEIMLRRRNKILTEDVKQLSGEAGIIIRKDICEKASDRTETHRGHRFNDSLPSGMKHPSDDYAKVSSWKKDDSTSIKGDNLQRNQDKDDRDSKIKLKSIVSRDTGDKTKTEKSDRQLHYRRKNDQYSNEDSENELRNRYSRDTAIKEKYSERSRGKSEKDGKRRHQKEDVEEKESKRRHRTEDDERHRENNVAKKNDSEERKGRHWTQDDERRREKNVAKKNDSVESKRRHQTEDDERRREKNVAKKNDLVESKRRHQTEDDERRREKNVAKKNDSEESKRRHRTEEDERFREKNVAKKNDLESFQRKEMKESSHYGHEGSRPKRRRSRSKERDKDKGESKPLSPRVHKPTSSDVREQEELSLHSYKDRSGKQLSDADGRLSTNGSSAQYRRPGGSASGLGGYSPRKRKTEAAVRTPSPTARSPEKKSAGWDLQPAVKDSNLASSVISNLQSSYQTSQSVAHELPSAVPIASTVKLPFGGFPIISTNLSASIDSIQLTEASRPRRRLYVENLPASASEKDIIAYLNNFLLSSGVNYISGTQPCISCIIHKEKRQALVEFLTPEYASAALSFDGRSFYDSILKIRRPKDFVEVASGVLEKPVVAVNSISYVVKDSPHKIFVGGISNVISSDMLMKIVSAFGPLKAYHFEVNSDLNEPCAFLEYVDQSLALKACAGLNGMKLGGRVLTAVHTIPETPLTEYNGDQPFYGIPEHARPLLEKSTQVLKLKNVLDPDSLSLLTELELEEILEDIRLECARFGTVKSVNVVKGIICGATDIETYEEAADNNTVSATDGHENDKNTEAEIAIESMNGYTEKTEISERTTTVDTVAAAETADPNCQETSIASSREFPVTQSESHEENVVADDAIKIREVENEDKSGDCKSTEEINGKLEEEHIEQTSELEEDVFEPGCILVEYLRTEASSMAAHCLHGRLFDNRIVQVSYVPCDIYRAKFPR